MLLKLITVLLLILSLNIYSYDSVPSLPQITSDSGLQFKERMEFLDDLRLRDSAEFRKNLRYLESETGNFNNIERDYFHLLQAFSIALTGDFDTAQQHIQSLINRSETVNKTLRFRAKSLSMNLYSVSKNFANASELTAELIRELPLVEDERAVAQTLSNLALFYNKIGKPEHSLQIYNDFSARVKAPLLKCRLKPAYVRAVILSENNHLRELSNVIDLVDEAISLCSDVGDFIPETLLQAERIKVLNQQRRFDEATHNFHKVSYIANSTNYLVAINYINVAIAETKLLQSDPLSAIEFASKALSGPENLSLNYPLVDAHKILHEAYKALNQPEKALSHFEEYFRLEQTHRQEKAESILAYNLAHSLFEINNQRIQLLDKDNELLTLERNLYQQQAENRYLLLLLIGSLSLILGLLTYRGLTRSKRYRKMAEFDQLTGISNRYHFTEQAQREIAHCIRAQRPVALILFDLDHFKNINDRFGHAAGDWTLRQVVLSCRNFIRHSDIFGRIGGEEFVVLLTDCTAEQASMLAEICRTALADIDTSGYQQQFKVTASFGVADSNQAGYDLSALLAAADAAMYQAKQQGRNQVYCPATADGARAC